MLQFQTVFPEIIESCPKLYRAMVLWALPTLVLSFAFELSRGFLDFAALTRFLVKLFLIVLLITEANMIMNSGQLAIEDLLQTSGLIRPEKLADDFRTRLAETTGDPSIKKKSAAGLLFSGRFVDAFLYVFLLVISYICLGIITFITFVQKMALLICWACCPVLFAMLAIPPVAHLGSAHLMRIFAILCWPIGFAVAATFSDGLLSAALNDQKIAGAAVAASLGAAVEKLILLMVVGIWSITSTILAPAFVQRFLVGSAGSAQIISGAGEAGAAHAGAAASAMGKAAGGAFRALRSRLSSLRDNSPGSSPPPASPAVVPHSPPPTASFLKSRPIVTPSDPNGSVRLKELLDS